MRASVIVVSYNSRADLAPCLDSIMADLGSDDEVIVVDNASSDGSADLIRERYPQVRLIANANTGYAGGNNCGAAAARGEYLVLLNPDTVIQPGAIDALLAPLQADGEIGLTTACVVHMDRPDLVNTCGNTVHATGLTYCRGAGRPRGEYAEDAEVDAASGAACAIRRDLFRALGGFDEQFFMYCEDTDLSLRARLAGYRCIYTAHAVVRHAYRPGYTPRKALLLDRNRHLMLLNNLSWRLYGRLLPALLLGEIVTAGFLVLQGPRFWSVKLRVYRSIWQHRDLIRSRRAGQRLRRSAERDVASTLTHRLEFGQLANRYLALGAALVFDPAFWIARRVIVGR